VTAARGTEGALRRELLQIGVRGVKGDRGGVRVHDDAPDVAMRVCLGSRVAVRVLVPLGRFPCPDEDALHDGVAAIDWRRWLDASRTLAISAVSRDSRLSHTGFLAQRAKDAIVDGQRRREGRRSDVARHDPDVGIFLRVHRDEAQLFLDASGGSLHKRGWRLDGGPAPLKETLAAALLRLAKQDPARPFFDPLCGSGTLVIEADLAARQVPPQKAGRRFGFERWADWDRGKQERLAELRGEREARRKADGPPCVGVDRDREAIERAREHARRAGSRARFEVGALRRQERPTEEAGLWLSNPPYGQRMELDETFERDFAEVSRRLADWDLGLILPRETRDPRGRGRPAVRHALFNGGLPCHLLLWPGAARP
jgi:23S rRNA G2445 N2-methylase RlmL